MLKGKKLILDYWMLSWIFAILFGEAVKSLILHSTIFINNLVAIMIFYAFVCLIFALLFERLDYRLVLVTIFLCGIITEVTIFKSMNKIIFAGFFYIFLFGVPWWMIQKWDKEE